MSFTPPTAPVVDRADCLTQDIYSRLTGLGPWGSADEPPKPSLGYPPDDFEPISVVRCDLAQHTTGTMSVDSVSLGGDVGALARAFSMESERFPDNVQASCAIGVEPAVGLWLVDARGRAFRPAWPSVPCSFREEPLEALRALHETGRESFDTGVPVDLPRYCTERTGGTVFSARSAEETARRALNSSIRPLLSELALPVDDAGPLQVCRYGVGFPEPGGSVVWLSAAQSADMIRTALTAPPAAPCTVEATRTAAVQLRRADGSGGAALSVELDGCRRVGQNAAPAALIEMLSR
ncbi:MAG: hypothetical protein DI630_18400 [Gordonia sp. (in: high G+C Gram-positive bacteria)]|nr:MAG: hypothetical protein DI630_18400 [Gordonia sp. (in: high G+C Gram-positive bacteria)]